MIRTMVNKSRRALALSAVAVMSLCGPAKAAEFVVNWDPVFNAAFDTAYSTNLGWKGSAKVTVPAGCLTPISDVHACAAVLTEYTVTFYDFVSTATIDTVAATGLTLSVPTVSIDGLGLVDGIDLLGSIVFTSGPLDAYASGADTFTAYLDFVIGAYTGPTLRLDRCFDDCPFFSGTDPDNRRTFPIVTWSEVPAPATLALVGVALAALGLRRRKA